MAPVDATADLLPRGLRPLTRQNLEGARSCKVSKHSQVAEYQSTPLLDVTLHRYRIPVFQPSLDSASGLKGRRSVSNQRRNLSLDVSCVKNALDRQALPPLGFPPLRRNTPDAEDVFRRQGGECSAFLSCTPGWAKQVQGDALALVHCFFDMRRVSKESNARSGSRKISRTIEEIEFDRSQ